jgi:hypothetical protein
LPLSTLPTLDCARAVAGSVSSIGIVTLNYISLGCVARPAPEQVKILPQHR